MSTLRIWLTSAFGAALVGVGLVLTIEHDSEPPRTLHWLVYVGIGAMFLAVGMSIWRFVRMVVQTYRDMEDPNHPAWHQ